VVFGSGTPEWRVVVDPIDGSLNARRTLPSHSLSVAIASGSSMADVELGFVHDFGAAEEFTATRNGGAEMNGGPLRAQGPDYGLEVVGLESSDPARIAPVIAALEGKTYRIRSVGSIAITLCYVAGGRFDGMLSARACRSVDAAAAQLIVREAGGVVKFAGHELADADLGLDARYQVAAALDEEMLATVLEAQATAPRDP
jgi:myo-inositol-1(or 4)-monophosphatase